jgi:hypothetical protein
MNKNKDFVYLSSLFILAIAAYIYSKYIYMLGFPDGHLTELNRAEKILFSTFIYVSIFLSLVLFYIGSIDPLFGIDRKIWLTLFSYLFLVFSTFLIDYYLQLHLDRGIG